MPRLVPAGAELERARGGQKIQRHHHETAYAALVLRGGYVEAGDCGRIRAEPGHVLFHAAFEGHFDTIGDSGADILNLPLSSDPDYAHGRCADPDAVANAARSNLAAAARLLVATTARASVTLRDWPDLLAAALSSGLRVRLDHWAAEHGLNPSTVSRGFALSYGTTPKRYRLEQRGALAARAIRAGASLSDIAFASGFADQPHMSRTVRDLFGRSPGQLRN